MVHVDDVADAVVFFCGDARKNGKGIFILSDDLDMPTILELTGAPSNSPGKRIRYTIPLRLLYLAALAGSAGGVSFFNLRRLTQLTNEARFSSARIRQIYPEWPRAGSRDAVRNFAAGK
jgi:nucleoside-diphosphate-sugar epimerase